MSWVRCSIWSMGVTLGLVQASAMAEICALEIAPVQVRYTLYLADTGASQTASTSNAVQTSCSDSMKSDLVLTQEIYQTAGVQIDFSHALQEQCAVYQHVSGNLADYINQVAVELLYGPQRSLVVDDFKTKMKSEGLFDDQLLNVYYVPAPDVVGYHVRQQDGTSEGLIFIGGGARVDSLSHEFAHAFSLEHVNFWDAEQPQNEYCVEHEYWDNRCDFTDDNVMWTSNLKNQDALEPRRTIHGGQHVRMFCNGTSALVSNGDHKPNPVTHCPDWSVEGACPPLNDTVP